MVEEGAEGDSRGLDGGKVLIQSVQLSLPGSLIAYPPFPYDCLEDAGLRALCATATPQCLPRWIRRSAGKGGSYSAGS